MKVQGSGAQRSTWLMLLFLALVIPLWLWSFTMFAKQKKEQPGGGQASPKVFPSLLEIKQSQDINQAILVWKEQVEENPKAPDADLALLKVAIAYEYVLQPPDYRAAFRAYRALGERYKRSPFAVHALFRAGQLAEQQLGEPELAIKFYEGIERSHKDEEAVVWNLSGGEFVTSPATQGRALKGEVLRNLDGYYRDRGLYKALAVLVRICGNDKRYSYGLALLLTAILVQGFLWLLPFTRRQYETMRKMQEMAPEIKKIQQTFKGDPRRMQMEVFSLYKRHHFNPMTGCFLGMLIQIPFLWGVFAAIRHFQYPLMDASFLWVRSLALPDLPLLILYCGSMYLTTRYGPGTDPSQAQQQKMMAWLMPAMFFFFFRTWPSGFLLYWLATNLLSMGQRYLIMHKRSGVAVVHPSAPSPVTVEGQLSGVPALAAADPIEGDPAAPDDSAVAQGGPDLPEAEVMGGMPPQAQIRPAVPLYRGTRKRGKSRRRRSVTGHKKG